MNEQFREIEQKKKQKICLIKFLRTNNNKKPKEKLFTSLFDFCPFFAFCVLDMIVNLA